MAAVALVFGIAAGKSVNTTPRYFGKELFADYSARPPSVDSVAQPQDPQDLPDHYAMRTPRGTVDVYELSFYMRDRSHWAEMKRYEHLAAAGGRDSLWDGEVEGFTPEPEHFRPERETQLALNDASATARLTKAAGQLIESSVQENGVRVHRASAPAQQAAASKPAVRMVSRPVIQPLPKR
jgi:hypothetical protein